MGSKFIVVVGDGETTRSNIEALVTDFFYDRSKDYVLLLPFTERPSQGQVWTHQVFQELGMLTTALAPEGAIVMNLSSSSLNTVPNPVGAAVEAVEGEEAHIFALVDEDHPMDLTGFKTAQAPCYNLCRGLMALNDVEPVQRLVEAKIPAVTKNLQEQLPGPSNLMADLSQLMSEFSASLVDILKEHGAIK
jgi:hypothetical protein